MNTYTYKSCGVDIKKANDIIKNVKDTFNLSNLENFAGIFNNKILKNYNLLSCTDGIGSKIIPLTDYNMPDVIANDLVAMNLNDLIAQGAKPLFFLDYIASNNLKGNIIENTIKHLKLILEKYNCSLLGGEISELPSLIKENYFDIAGFMVGIAKNNELFDKNKIKKGDVIIALKSNGIHSNGFSIIRKLYEDKKINETVFKSTLKKTKIYFDEVNILRKYIKSSANITGGGIYNNLKRIIPNGLDIKIDKNSIIKQEIFEIIKNFTDIEECYQVFNMGVGFCIISDKKNTDKILNMVDSAFAIGEVV